MNNLMKKIIYYLLNKLPIEDRAEIECDLCCAYLEGMEDDYLTRFLEGFKM